MGTSWHAGTCQQTTSCSRRLTTALASGGAMVILRSESSTTIARKNGLLVDERLSHVDSKTPGGFGLHLAADLPGLDARVAEDSRTTPCREHLVGRIRWLLNQVTRFSTHSSRVIQLPPPATFRRRNTASAVLDNGVAPHPTARSSHQRPRYVLTRSTVPPASSQQ